MTEPVPYADSAFPLRVAAVDVGSNAIRFTAAEFLDRSRKIPLHYQRVPIRLGQSAFVTGRLAPDAIEAALGALALFKRHMVSLGVKAYRAVATSAVRESENGAELVLRARREADLAIETITGSEEARLVWLAVRDRLPLQGRWLMVDLGGGSLEVSLLEDGSIEWSESHSVGSVRLLEVLGGDGPGTADLASLLHEYVGTLRLPYLVRIGLQGVVATGGNMEALAQLAGVSADAAGVARVPTETLEATVHRLQGMTCAERMRAFDLREDRADVIVPAGHIYLRVLELAGAGEVVVPHVGVKDGVLLDVVEELTTHALHASHQELSVRGAAVALGRRYRFDEAHGVHVARLALSLFDELDNLHELDETDRLILLGAAVLHDIGQAVSYRKHHKHSQYLIQHGDLSVYAPSEIPLVALIARYHRGSGPRDDHDIWSGLGAADRKRVLRLAALLRVADSLDRQHLQHVERVRATVDDDVVRLEVEATGDLLLERWALERKGRLFEKAFRKTAEIVQMKEVA